MAIKNRVGFGTLIAMISERYSRSARNRTREALDIKQRSLILFESKRTANPGQPRPAAQRAGVGCGTSDNLRRFRPGSTSSRYSLTGTPNLRQDSTTEIIAATFGPDCTLPTCSQFFDLLRQDPFHKDQKMYETVGPLPDLIGELEVMRAVHDILLSRFQIIDAVGLSGGTERVLHLVACNQIWRKSQPTIRSAYVVGAFNAAETWYSRYDQVSNGTKCPDVEHHGLNDMCSPEFGDNFVIEELAVVGIVNHTSVAFAINPFDGGDSKYILHKYIVNLLERLHLPFYCLGEDPKGTFFPVRLGLFHELFLGDYLEFLKKVSSGPVMAFADRSRYGACEN